NLEERHAAADVLEKRIGPEGKAAVPALIEALQDKDGLVQCRAAGALGKIGPEARDAGPALRRAFRKSGDFFLRAAVVEALGRSGKPGVAALIDALESKNEFIREQAAAGLGKIGSEAREAVPALLEMLKKDDEKDRVRACQALGKIGLAAREAV